MSLWPEALPSPWPTAPPLPGVGQPPGHGHLCIGPTLASGRNLTIGLNASSLVTSVTDPLGNKWTYAYTSGNLTSVTDPMSRVTSYSYDSSNANPTLVHDLLTLTAPNGQTGGSHAGAKLTNNYNGSGMVTSQVDPQSRTTTFNYGAMNTGTGNGDTVVTDPDGNQNEYLYSTGILDASVVGYGSSVPSDTYYTLSTTTLLPSSVIDPDGGVTSTTYDSSGNVLTTTDQLGRVSTNTYNGFDETTCSTKALSASPCSSLSPPAAVSPGGTITPPSAPPAFVTYTLYGTSGNQLFQTQGVSPAGCGHGLVLPDHLQPLSRQLGDPRDDQRHLWSHPAVHVSAVCHHRRQRQRDPAGLQLERRCDQLGHP